MSKRNSRKTVVTQALRLPANLLAPVSDFLRDRLRTLELRKKNMDEEDPFQNSDRLTDNAAPDTEAEEQFGHARTSAVRAEIEKKIIQTRKALARVKVGKYGICENCGKMIDTDRLMVYPEATYCVSCEVKRRK